MDKSIIHELHKTMQTVFILLVDCMPHHAEQSEKEMMEWYGNFEGRDYYNFIRKYGDKHAKNIFDDDDTF